MTARVFNFTTRTIHTREIKEAKCNSCGHTWLAPTVGKCPKPSCGSDNTQELSRHTCDAPRVR